MADDCSLLRWQFYNDPCYDFVTTEVSLNMNACTDEEYNCVDGHCIDIEQRCDGKIDCPDRTGKAN